MFFAEQLDLSLELFVGAAVGLLLFLFVLDFEFDGFLAVPLHLVRKPNFFVLKLLEQSVGRLSRGL